MCAASEKPPGFDRFILFPTPTKKTPERKGNCSSARRGKCEGGTIAVPPLRNIRAQAAPLHGAGAPQANKKDARNIKAIVPPQGGGSVKGEPLWFPLCVISGHRAPHCTGQVFPTNKKDARRRLFCWRRWRDLNYGWIFCCAQNARSISFKRLLASSSIDWRMWV